VKYFEEAKLLTLPAPNTSMKADKEAVFEKSVFSTISNIAKFLTSEITRFTSTIIN
jgi:hypothetical protein